MGKIKKGDYVCHHAVAEKDLEKKYPKINILMTKVKKVSKSTFEDEDGSIYLKRRVSTIFREGNKIANDVYDQEQNFKEDLEALTND